MILHGAAKGCNGTESAVLCEITADLHVGIGSGLLAAEDFQDQPAPKEDGRIALFR